MARARLFAFPHAGGGASAFFKLRAECARFAIDLCPLQPAGRENRSTEAFPDSLEALACECADAIATLPPLPFALLGHSMGGGVAYLTARRLVERGLVPEHLIASGSVCPLLSAARTDRAETLSQRDRLIGLGGIPEPILADPELYAMFEAVILSDLRLADAYRHRPAPPLPCPVLVYAGASDAAVPPSISDAWQGLTRHALRKRTFQGGHFFLYADPKATAQRLAEDLGWGGPKGG